jgi:hypothetical protein
MQTRGFRTKAAALVMSMLFLATSGWAIPPAPCDTKPQDVCCEEPKPGPYAFSFPMDMNLACPRDFYFYGDFLALQPREEGLEYAIENTNGSGGFPLRGGDVKGFGTPHHSWSWDFGFRIGVGFYLNHDQWEFDLSWFWYNNNQETSSATVANTFLIPLWFNLDPQAGNQQASARWGLTMNILDISLGKPYHISRYVVFHPFFGVRAAWIDQTYVARYGGDWQSESGVKFIGKNDFWGVGPRIGVNTKWYLGADFELLANISTSFLIGDFDVTQNTQHSALGIQVDPDIDLTEPNLDIQLGVSWGTYFNNKQNHFALQVMGEFQQWWDQLQFRKFYSNTLTFPSDTVSRGDLTIQGVSVRFLFNF